MPKFRFRPSFISLLFPINRSSTLRFDCTDPITALKGRTRRIFSENCCDFTRIYQRCSFVIVPRFKVDTTETRRSNRKFIQLNNRWFMGSLVLSAKHIQDFRESSHSWEYPQVQSQIYSSYLWLIMNWRPESQLNVANFRIFSNFSSRFSISFSCSSSLYLEYSNHYIR